MAHYSTRVYLTATDEAQRLTAWQITIPRLALSCQYLRHGLLAFSAMHFRLACPQHRQSFYADLARQHLAKALDLYIPHLRSNTEGSCAALFAFSTLVPALSYSFLQAVDTDLQGEDFIRQFLCIWNYLHGAKLVAHEARPWIHQSVISSLVTLRKLEDRTPYVEEDTRMALQTPHTQT